MRQVLTAVILSTLLTACVSKPDGIEPVKGLEVQRYLGKWYEIARLDHSFEENLQAVTAEYSRREDGGLKVVNRGFNVETGEWEEALGKAFFVEDPNTGYLKVSFFGPFYGAYVIFELGDLQPGDGEYDYVFLTGNSREYLWLLARTPQVSEQIKAAFVKRSEALGFATENLIFVDHEPPFPKPGEPEN
ncbi:lipocalin [Proteobacteria bacterium 005FR1]|nr:lipocalin [Proteobacteria bacterium 005FR1]